MQSFLGSMRNAPTRFRSTVFRMTGALFLAALTGCIHVEQTLTLHNDGSGELDVTYGMSTDNIAQMQATSKHAMEAEGGSNEQVEAAMPFNFNEDDIRADFKEYEQHGVMLKSVRVEETNSWKFVYLEIAFRDLEGLSKTEFVSDRSMSLVKNEAGRYVFREAANNPPDDEAPEGADQQSVKDMMAGFMKGFHAVMKVKTPAKILSTNAGVFDGQSATWEFDLEKDPQALERAQKLDMQVEFDATGLNIAEFKPASPEKH